ncbi:MAG: OmpA family protein [Alphaproteobacteria bacterium]
MKLAAHREYAAIPRPAWPVAYEANVGRARLRRASAIAFAAALVSAMAATPVAAQQTLVIGDDKPKTNSGGPLRPDAAGVTINNDVLDSLGSPGTFAPAPPPSTSFAAPAHVGQAPQVAPGTAYRLPGTGQLVISRPSTLLFPPPTFPSSHLTVPTPPGRTARKMTAPDTEKAQSRLLVPKPVEPTAPEVADPAPAVATAVPREPVTEEPVTEEPAIQEPVVEDSGTSAAIADIPPVSEPAPAPFVEPTPPPVAPVAPKTEPIVPAEPAAVTALPLEPEPAAEEPAVPSLTSELQSAPETQSASPSPTDEPAAAPAPSAAITETPPESAPEEPEAMPEPEPEPTQSAALTPAIDPVSEIRLAFKSGSAELTTTATDKLDSMAKKLLGNADARVQLLAYAKASEEGSSRARRLSLSRALAVRAYLIEKGIRSTRMDVRALGSGFKDGPPDRVDILPQSSTQ